MNYARPNLDEFKASVKDAVMGAEVGDVLYSVQHGNDSDGFTYSLTASYEDVTVWRSAVYPAAALDAFIDYLLDFLPFHVWGAYSIYL